MKADFTSIIMHAISYFIQIANWSTYQPGLFDMALKT